MEGEQVSIELSPSPQETTVDDLIANDIAYVLGSLESAANMRRDCPTAYAQLERHFRRNLINFDDSAEGAD